MEADKLTEVLLSAAAAVKAVTSALDGNRLSQPLLDRIQIQPSRMHDCGSLSTAAVAPNVRDAAVRLAHHLQAANKALKAQLLAAGQHGACDEAALPVVALHLQRVALGLMLSFKLAPQGDSDLAFRVMAAGVVCIDGGSLACSLPHASVDCKNGHIISLTEVLGQLDAMASLEEGHKRSLAVLRATTFRPEVVLAALRRLLPDQAIAGVNGGLKDVTDILQRIFHALSCFEAERDAIGRDTQLQTGIVASLDGIIRCMVGLAATVSMEGNDYVRVCSAIILLASRELQWAAEERAASNPTGLLRTLSACFDLILRQPQSEVGAKMETHRCQALHFWGTAVHHACCKDRSGRPPLITEFLGAVQRAAMATAILLRRPDIDAALHNLCHILHSGPALYLGPGVDRAKVLEAAGSTDAALCALFLAAAAALEGITRVAALLPEQRQLKEVTDEDLLNGFCNITALTAVCMTWCWPEEQPRPSVVASEAAMMAAAGVVDSLAKLALTTAGRSAARAGLGPTKFEDQLCHRLFSACAIMIRNITSAVMSGHGATMGPPATKRWQGVSLVVSSAAVALKAHFSESPWRVLPLYLLTWPGNCNLLPLVAVGRSAVHQAVMGLSDMEEGDPVDSQIQVAAIFLALEKYTHHGGSALSLAQIGVLTQLASWTEQQFGKLASQGRAEGLRVIWHLVDTTVRSCGVAQVQAAYEILLEGGHQVDNPAYWRHLRTEVTEPLAAALEAKAAAETDAAQVAVDVAEALATRACAYVGCTTVVGVSEAAAPRGKRCSACRLVRYCGAACQKADWRAHKAACRELCRRRSAGS